MSVHFQTIAIIGKYMNASQLQLMQVDLADLARHLSAKNLTVLMEENTAKHAEISGFKTVKLSEIGAEADLAIVLGGDGTMLSVARSLLNSDVPLVGINRGRFGFLTDIRTDHMLQAMDEILDQRYQSEPRMCLTAQVMRGGVIMQNGVAMNDVVIKSGLRLIEFEVEIDGKFVHKQRADGLIISTPTGTTAYALSAGGPILHPSLEAIALVPISPHTLSNRPIAISSVSKIEITIMQSDDAQLSYDGQQQSALEIGDRILIVRAAKTVTLLHPEMYSYYDMLRNKLNWS